MFLETNFGPNVKASLEVPEVQTALRAYRTKKNPKTLHVLRSALVAAGVPPSQVTKRLIADILRTRRWAGAENAGHNEGEAERQARNRVLNRLDAREHRFGGTK